jgi:hypothetical protein
MKRLRRLPLSGLVLSISVAGLLTAYFAAEASAGTVRATTQANSVQKGPVAGTYGNHWASLPDPPLPTSGPASMCGPWSAQNSPQAEAIQSAHGIIESCLLVGDDWVVTTQTASGTEIGELACSPADSTCMNGWDAKSLTAFTWQAAPASITFMQIATVQGSSLTMLTNDGQWTFDVGSAATHAWARMGAAQ